MESLKPHTLIPFEQALESLRANVLMMAGLTLRSLRHVEHGLFQRKIDECNIAIADDEEVDALEVQIDQAGVDLLIRFQPVAGDLRQVIGAMKISSNIERIADQVVSIGRRARKLNEHPALPELHQLQPMFHLAAGMFEDSIRYYSERNEAAAREMKMRDRELDALNKKLTDVFTDAMQGNVGAIRGYLNLIFIARVLERIGDHATNICEEVVYVCAAEDIRHAKRAERSP